MHRIWPSFYLRNIAHIVDFHMNNSMRNVVCCLTAAILLVTTSGCDWMVPLTSPSRATVDKRLLGFWKARSSSGKMAVCTISECAKLGKGALGVHPNLPGGAMFVTYAGLNELPSPYAAETPIICWPTQIGSTSYLNVVLYNMKTKKLVTDGRAYIIYKYVVTGDSLTFYELKGDAKKRIKSRLGTSYQSADLLEEFSKATEWARPTESFTRIRFQERNPEVTPRNVNRNG